MKHYYVPWEGHSSGKPYGEHELDRLCLQGPHTLERAQEVARDIRSAGMMASVIDCSESLKNAHCAREMKVLLEKIRTELCASRIEDLRTEISELLAKAEGR